MLRTRNSRPWWFALFLVCPAIAGGAPPDTNYDEAKVPHYTLPDVLVTNSGKAVTTAQEWHDVRRPEILSMFETAVYGKTPKKPLSGIRYEVTSIDTDALDGTAIRKLVRIHLGTDDAPKIDVLLYVPKHAAGPAPCFLGLNFFGNQTVHSDPGIPINQNWMRNRASAGIRNYRATEASRGVNAHRWQVKKVVGRGYALATAYYGDIDPDNYRNDFNDGVHPLFYEPGQTRPSDTEWGTIGAWAWGLSRILDYLETDEDIDARRVAVLGHSRLGKTALWAGAQDDRFALVISNNSGCGGAALYRRRYGERIDHMVKGIGCWFCRAHSQYANREAELPVDQHMLLALIAPRPLYVASATNDRWADPKGEFLAAWHASPVYALFGQTGIPTATPPPADHPVGGIVAYHLRNGDHDVTAYDWDQYLAFADKHLAPKK